MIRIALFLPLAFGVFVPAPAHATVQHHLVVTLTPSAQRLSVSDRIRLPASAACRTTFLLHADLAPVLTAPAGARLTLLGRRTVSASDRLDVEEFGVELPCGSDTFSVRYEGTIFHPVVDVTNPYSRGGADSPGLISGDGVVLSSRSYWYPQVAADPFVSFTLEASAPDGWSVVSQGDEAGEGAWRESRPQDDFFLIAARFSVYRQAGAQGTQLLAYLRSPDPALARRYLDATSGYLERYAKLVGPYPYSKFALVENFWDTGFGMPSFTLLGGDILRLPFILTTSYPHEILHDWWGNGVFVDRARGNWCEGITVYMADHLMAEKEAAGVPYRRDLLQRFTDFVNPGNDFPLSRFLERVDAPTEAIGYGKSMMFFHMLRRAVGDDAFREAFRRFYRQNQFQQVSFGEIRAAFEATLGRSFAPEFGQWVSRTGAPQLRLEAVSSSPVPGGFALAARIDQVQAEAPFSLEVPVSVHLEGEAQAVQKTFRMDGRNLDLHEIFPKRPVWLEVDPEFDVFRRLGADEVPSTVTMALGAPRSVFVLPSAASAADLASWRAFAEAVSASLPRGAGGKPDVLVVLDSEAAVLPASGRAAWVLGKENRFLPAFAALLADPQVRLTAEGLALPGKNLPFAGHSFFLVARDESEGVYSFVASDGAPTFPVLAEKILHYGKYSYLAFDGPGVSNLAKGTWAVPSSSLSVPVPQSDGVPVSRAKGTLAPRRALAD